MYSLMCSMPNYQQLTTKGTGHSNGCTLQALESIGNGFPYAQKQMMPSNS